MKGNLIYVFFIATFFINLSFAEVCPSVKDLKQNNFQGWHAYDSENGLPLSPVRLAEFKKQLNSFILAEWMQNAPEGSGHCFYSGKSMKTNLRAFLAKQRLTPDTAMNHWKTMGHAEVMQCKSQKIKECIFQTY